MIYAYAYETQRSFIIKFYAILRSFEKIIFAILIGKQLISKRIYLTKHTLCPIRDETKEMIVCIHALIALNQGQRQLLVNKKKKLRKNHSSGWGLASLKYKEKSETFSMF